MKYLLFFILPVWAWLSIHAQNNRIVANPMNLNYRFQFDEPSRREAADPVVEYFKGKYYLFASKSGGYWSSADLVKWTYIPCTTIATQENYAPTVLVLGETLYYMTGGSPRIFCTNNPDTDEWYELIPVKFEYGTADPAFFKDEDTGKVYIIWGCSDSDPIMGVEVDPSNGFKSIGTPVVLIEHKGEKYGWEVPGKNNEEHRTGWNEGPCMIKHQGKYYLQYAAPGTEYRIYADGVYIGDTPLGPFTYMENSPFSIKPGGFIGGAGHGHTFKDEYGNYWHVASMRISVRHSFERRLGLFPVYFSEGNLYAHTVYTDYPFIIPNKKVDFETDDCSMNWHLLSYKKTVSASSFFSGFVPENANNEEIENWWSAQTGNAGEWWQVDLEKSMQVNAVQVNFADQDFTTKAPNSYVIYQYRIETSDDGKAWTVLVDRTQNIYDMPHELIVLDEPQQMRYLRITNTQALNGKFSLSGFRVFGKDNGIFPNEVSGFQAKRKNSDQRRFLLEWNGQDNVTGYIVHWGVNVNRLNNAVMVFTNQLEAGFFNKDSPYYFSVDAFNESGIVNGTIITEGSIFLGTPYGGNARKIPCTIEAEDFNEGGNGSAYYDTSKGNFFREYREEEDVDIAYYRTKGIYYLADTRTREYTNYSIEVPESGLYDFDCIAVSINEGYEGSFYLSFDGEILTDPAFMTIPSGSRSNFHTVTLSDIPFTEGLHVLTFNMKGDIYVDKFVIRKGGDKMENFIQPSISVYPNPSEGIFHVQLPNDDLFLFVADIYGQNLYSRYTQEASTIIDLSKYPKEIYILSVEGNSQKYRAKLVKK